MNVAVYLKQLLIDHGQLKPDLIESDVIIANRFIDWVVKDKKIFKEIIPSLPTRKIKGSITLLECALTTKLTRARFLINEMLKKNELTIHDQSRISWLLFSANENPHLNPKEKKRTTDLLSQINNTSFNVNGFNLVAYQGARIPSQHEKIMGLVNKFPRTEFLLASIVNNNFAIAKLAIDTTTPEELLDLLTFRSLQLPLELPIPFTEKTFTIEAGHTALDVALKLEQWNILFSLTKFASQHGQKSRVEQWFKDNPRAQLIRDAREFQTLALQISNKEQFPTFRLKQQSLEAKHPEETKAYRKRMKELFYKLIIALFQTQNQKLDSEKNVKTSTISRALKAQVKTTLSLNLNATSIHLYQFTEFNHPPILQRDEKAIILKYPLDEILTRDNLMCFLPGNKLETTNLNYPKPKNVMDSLIAFEKSEAAFEKQYLSLIYPAVKTALKKICFGKAHNFLVDLRGNTNTAKIVMDSRIAGLKYLLLNSRKSEIDMKLLKLSEKSSIVKIDLVNDSDYYQDCQRKTLLANNSVDVFISFGALSFYGIDNRECALTVLKRVHSYLKPGGYLIDSSVNSSYLNSDDFNTNGFIVHNKMIPGSAFHFYIVKKKQSNN